MESDGWIEDLQAGTVFRHVDEGTEAGVSMYICNGHGSETSR
jgi:hypothetical protein